MGIIVVTGFIFLTAADADDTLGDLGSFCAICVVRADVGAAREVLGSTFLLSHDVGDSSAWPTRLPMPPLWCRLLAPFIIATAGCVVDSWTLSAASFASDVMRLLRPLWQLIDRQCLSF
jgi:hypothetical protein